MEQAEFFIWGGDIVPKQAQIVVFSSRAVEFFLCLQYLGTVCFMFVLLCLYLGTYAFCFSRVKADDLFNFGVGLFWAL